jgi:citrate lyase subunit beta/citryl-CoA lyase
VSPESKDAARDNAVKAASSGEYGKREVTIRCNGLDTPWGAADIAAAAKSCASSIVIPKVGDAAAVDAVSKHLDAAGAPAEMLIWAMIETPSAIFNARSIAAHPRVAVLVMGTNDLVKELHAAQVPGRAPVISHLATSLLAAREADKPILDGVYNDIKNAEGFRAECVQGMQMGFDGKTLIHPDQVAIANEVWAPGELEVEHARRVIEAFDAARAEGKGVVQLDGKMIESLHVANAERLIAIASAIAELV